jgi:subfamily B ATP-binding cassette protein MsbA
MTAPESATPAAPINFRRLIGYARPYLPQLGIALFALILTTAVDLAYPPIVQMLIDSVITQKNYDLLNRIAGGLALIFTLRFFAGYGQQYFLSYMGERIVVDLRKQLYAHLHTLSLRFFTERRVGEIVSRLASDVTMVRSVLTGNVATFISQSLIFVGAITIVIILNWRMTLFLLAIAPPMAIFATVFGRFLRKISTEVQDQVAATSTIADEVFQAVRVVKSFVREPFEIKRYQTAAEGAFEAAMRLTRVRSVFGPLMYTLTFLAMAGVLWYGGREVIAGRLTAGGLASFLFYLIFIGASVGSFTGLYTQVQEALGATRRIFEILDSDPDVKDAPDAGILPAVKGEIVFEKVSFHYDERIGVLYDLSLTVKPGEVLALVGPSGAGKSTVFNLIPRFYDPTDGRILIDGHDLKSITQESLRSQIGVVPQETLLFGGTVKENILYGKLEASEAEMIEAAKAANAHQFISDLPDGYETIVGERGVKLSGGQRQRVSIARAILKDPRILLLDEATSSLDSESEGLVQEALERLMQNRTTVIIAHRLSTVDVADRIATLEAGKLVELGTHQELLARDGLYARLYRMQFESAITL